MRAPEVGAEIIDEIEDDPVRLQTWNRVNEAWIVQPEPRAIEAKLARDTSQAASPVAELDGIDRSVRPEGKPAWRGHDP
jgi:hypothetical protein